MLSHVMLGTNDIDKAKKFYDAVLAVVGAKEAFVNENNTGQTRILYSHKGSTYMLSEPINGEPATVANGATIGIACDSPEQVKELHDVAVANGGTSVEGPPGPREGSMGVLHLSYFLDLDGHKICGLHRPS